MLRTNISKNISPKEQLILQTNHNFFIRTAIANVAKIVIASIILAVVVVATYAISAATITYATSSAVTTPILAILMISYIVYAIYFIATVSEIITLYKKSTAIENNILGADESVDKSKTSTIISTKQTNPTPTGNDEDL